MKPLPAFLLSLAPALLFAAEPGTIAIAVSHIPADATEIVAVVDTIAPTPVDYEDPTAPIAAPPSPANPTQPAAKADSPAQKSAAPAAKADPAAAKGEAPRRRRGRFANAALAFPPARHAVATNGATSLTVTAPVPAGDNYQVRVVALRGEGAFPTVLAGGRLSGLKVTAENVLSVAVALNAPKLELAADNPASVAPGAHYTLAGTITDAANCLGAKNRMRVWMSVDAPPRENFAGAQISTIDVKTDGDEVAFSFPLTAPATAGTLYFQFGELPADFARSDGTQAAFLVLPNLAAGDAPLTLRVEPAKTAGQ